MAKRNFAPDPYKKREAKKVRVHFIDLFAFRKSDIKRAKSFIVYLNKSMSCNEICERIEKVFGDAK